MNMTSLVLAIVAIVCGVAALVYGIHVAVVFQRFNDGIKDWAQALDASTQEAINRSARNILRELDEKVSSLGEEPVEEIVEPINNDEDE